MGHATAALACMQEIQAQCFRLGISLRTRHREVAPNQYEFAPLFGTATTQIDQNLVVMQIIEETAAQYGLAALLQEKPFNNINGSGKHNNWSIGTHDGVNLLNIGQITKAAGDDAFPTIMAAIVSTYLGDDMTEYLTAYAKGGGKYEPKTKDLSMGVEGMRHMEIPAQDRNRTSPFPYGGHRFEFRAVGSAQNVSLVNTVLNTITANAFKEVADRIEGGETAQAVAADLINTHVPKVVFNGDNYDEANQEMLTKRGVWRIDSGVDAICRYSDPKNTALFEAMGVLKPNECAARQEILLDHYVGTVDIEAKCMVDMINKHVLPSAKAAELPQVAALEAALDTLGKAIEEIRASSGKPQADLARTLRLETMIDIREVCDAAEGLCPADLWTLPTYTDLLFLDQTTNVDKNYFP